MDPTRRHVVSTKTQAAFLALVLLVGLSVSTDLHAAGRAGLIVVVDPGSAADLLQHAGDPSSLVHGLVASPAAEEGLRRELLKAGQTGRVTVSVWDGGRIPFVENTVNRIVCKGVTDEIRRALAPYGCAVDASGRTLWTKPYPKEMDEWTHYLYRPNGNSVSQDMLVGPPRRIQWVGAPQMLRHHDHLPSLSAMVSANGRAYYIFDEQTSASILFPPKWRLVARDAFNGVVLWKKRIAEWHPHLWPLKSMPATLPRRIVSVGDDVYVTLGIRAPVTHLNGVDGTQIKVYAGSEKCEEILVTDDTLLALRLVGKGPLDDLDAERGGTGKDPRATGFSLLKKLMGGNKSPLWLNAERRLIAYDVKSGGERWRSDGRFAPLSLATDHKRVYFHNGKGVVALDYRTGKKLWESPDIPIWSQFYAHYGASLVVCDDVVIFSGGENYDWVPPGTKKGANDTMTAVSALTGKKLWSAPHPSSGYRSPEDLMVAQGLVWAPDSMKASRSVLNGLDPKTGKVVRTINLDLGHGFHHRCHASRATETYLLASKVGINFVRFDGKGVVNDQWVRGACGFGILVANGMVYATPDPCNCFAESKLNGFAGLARTDPELAAYRKRSAAAVQTEKGESYRGGLASRTGEWPTYRANAGRTSSTSNVLPASFRPAWRAAIGGKLTAPVVAGGKVFLSSVEDNRVVAVDAASGKPAWTHVTGGRVDSPPTVVGELLYFGSADGHVTCLNAGTGQMVWRRRIAPTTEKIVDEGRVESVWPVHGSVTWHNRLIYAIAGRNMFVDGGITVCALDPLTGEARHSEVHELAPTATSGMNAVPSKPDVLSAEGDHLYMRSLAFDLQCKKTDSKTRHVFAVNGYLDDTWFHRAFWTYATGWKGGCGGFGATGNANPSGRIMIADGSDLYAYGRNRYGWGSSFTYNLYKAPMQKAAAGKTAAPASGNKGRKVRRSRKSRGGSKERTWSVDIPVLARSIIKAGDRLIVAGPRKLYDENEAIQTIQEASTARKIAAQAANWNKKADLLVLSSADGKVLQTVPLGFSPVWDGIAVAEQAVFVSGTDGVLYRLQ